MVSKAQIARYSLLPGILPRLLDFFSSGFAYIAYLLAVIYQGVKLLPENHPYTQMHNFGKFGIRHVVAAAAQNLVFSRQHIDQIFIFVVLLFGICLLAAQIIMLIFVLITAMPAFAAASPSTFQATLEMFSIPGATLADREANAAQDIAFILLDRVFGVPGIFHSCVSTSQACLGTNGEVYIPSGTPNFPWPFHFAMHELFKFYSLGLFVVGVFIIIYYVTAIVAETATTGTPFGQRMNKTWVPIRLILFLALLIPMTTTRVDGLNGAQLILLNIARAGSSFATNGWVYFNGVISDPNSYAHLTQETRMIAEPNYDYQEVKDLLQFMSVVHTCRSAYHVATETPIGAYIVRSTITSTEFGSSIPSGASAAFNNLKELDTTTFVDAREFMIYGDIVVRFGHKGELPDGSVDPEYEGYVAGVKPLCGEMVFKVGSVNVAGSDYIQEEYYNLIQDLWADGDLKTHAKCMIEKTGANMNLVNPNFSCPEGFEDTFIEGRVDQYSTLFTAAIENGVTAQNAESGLGVDTDILDRGWAGAALWYNRISELNGAVSDAAMGIPKPSKFPFLMEMVLKQHTELESNLSNDKKYSIALSDPDELQLRVDFGSNEKGYGMFRAMASTYNVWASSVAANAGTYSSQTGNVLVDFINQLLGTKGLFDMRKNTDVHPLAQLSSLGKGMMDALTRNFAIAAGLELSQGLGLIKDQLAGFKADSIPGFMQAMIAMTAGVAIMLYYLLPLMPFLYFLFAVSGWLKSIFEAMIAMPLWALGHLRIDGEGMMGPGAMNGYFLLFEIFLRPILILFGMICSIATFSALVAVLNAIFDSIVVNVGGFNPQYDASLPAGEQLLSLKASVIDEFFYTGVYAVLCYMLGIASFKLVDLIPSKILRWMGQGMQTFQEGAGDPVGKLTGSMHQKSILVTNQLRGRGSSMAEMG